MGCNTSAYNHDVIKKPLNSGNSHNADKQHGSSYYLFSWRPHAWTLVCL